MSLAVGYTAPEVWEATLAQLQLRITRQNFDSWLRDTAGLRYEGTTLVVGTPTRLAHDWLSARMKPAILQALTAVAGPGLQVQFEVTGAQQPDSPAEERPLQRSMIPALSTPLNPRFTFASFLAGDYNRLALSAALDVCSNADSPYSPLFITGPAGSGKTHLLHAIAQQACRQGQRVLLVPADKFLSEFTGAVKNRTGPAFRARYRDLDVLLVDDVHFLAGKKATQAEFFQTVAALHDLGRRVVLGGDLEALSAAAGARFASQLRWGLVAEIGQPSIDERVRFLCAKSACQGVCLPDEVVHYIGLRIRSGPRDLEGAINRVLALARISEGPIDIDFAARALQPVTEAPLASPPDIQPAAVIEAVCDHLNVERRDICGAKRTREASYARHISMYLLRQDAGLTYSAIAQLLGKKDHSSVVHACRQLQKQLEVSRPLKADIDAIRSTLNLPTAAA